MILRIPVSPSMPGLFPFYFHRISSLINGRLISYYESPLLPSSLGVRRYKEARAEIPAAAYLPEAGRQTRLYLGDMKFI
jgi:hypothetical protein